MGLNTTEYGAVPAPVENGDLGTLTNPEELTANNEMSLVSSSVTASSVPA